MRTTQVKPVQPRSKAEARRMIETHRRTLGHLSAYDEEQLAKTDPKWAETTRRAAEKSRKILGAYTKLIATDLSASGLRFILELLQNADDAAYDKNTTATISFEVGFSELVVESTERGFTVANVEAICSTGESSKVADMATTGEKGIGFKSVFSIADDVLIQSGFWSFRFSYPGKQDSMGMITPIWSEPEADLPPGTGTRFTLRFRELDGKARQQLVSYFEEFPETTMFAFRQLKCINIKINRRQSAPDCVTFMKQEFDGSAMTIHTSVGNGKEFGRHRTRSTLFHLFSTTIKDLPEHELRKERESVIILGFEDSDDNRTRFWQASERGPNVFAFLPVQNISQLPFLVHANFVLTASREEISPDPWNEGLKRGIVQAFVDAVKMIIHSSNQLSSIWMRFLPDIKTDRFWDGIHEQIKHELAKIPVLRSQEGHLKHLAEVRILPKWFLHNCEPLLPDTIQDIYLSSRYEQRDLSRLGDLGVQTITTTEVIERISHAIPDMQKRVLTDDWHSKFVLLMRDFFRAAPAARSMARSLLVIPLSDGKWVSLKSISSAPVYFPYALEETSIHVEIPGSLGLQRLHPAAYDDLVRREFYANQSVVYLDDSTLITSLLSLPTRSSIPSIQHAVAEAELLFWFGQPTSASIPRKRHQDLQFPDREGHLRRGMYLFFPTPGEYDAAALLDNTPTRDYQDFGFIHDRIWDSQMKSRIRHESDWLTWLRKSGVSSFPALTTPGTDELSHALRLVARDSPEKFIANLREHWSTYSRTADSVVHNIRDLQVPCRNGNSIDLHKAILPTPQLLTLCRLYKVESAMPLLQLPVDVTEDAVGSWVFLEKFGVTCGLTVDLYLRILRQLRRSTHDTSFEDCAGLYAGLATHANIGQAAELQKVFATEGLILAEQSTNVWVDSSDCVWSGPPFLKTYKVLGTRYKTGEGVRRLFKNLLEIESAGCGHVLSDLQGVSAHAQASGEYVQYSLEELRELYTWLLLEVHDPNELEEMRSAFKDAKLIFVQDQWCSYHDCIWSCDIDISGTFPLEPTYPTLRKFFLDTLRIERMDINVLIKKLLGLARKHVSDPEEMKRVLLQIGRMLSVNPTHEISESRLNDLLAALIFPVNESGTIRMKTSQDDFLINDHQRYGELFNGKISMLDFGFEDLSSLKIFLRRLRLEEKYVSKAVSANMTVGQHTLDQNLTEFLRDRAWALSCCAISHSSSKYAAQDVSRHYMLVAAKVFTCQDIWAEFVINQDGSDVTVRSDGPAIKVDESDRRLVLYVPESVTDLKACLRTDLPRELTRFLGIEDRAADKIIYRILNDQDRDLHAIVQEEQLHQCPWIPRPNSAQRVTTIPIRPASQRASTPQRATGNAAADGGWSFTPAVQFTSPRQGHENSSYRSLLIEVRRQAQQQAAHSLTATQVDYVSDALDGISLDDLFGTSGYDSSQRKKMIGAAGELFVFEYLKAVGIPNFTINNWQSTIRHLVRDHPDYTNLQPYSQPEISDIMYEGNSVRMQQFLRQNMAWPYPLWLSRDQPPTQAVNYHIEVKATTGAYNTTFFMSHHQFNLMQEKAGERQAEPPKDLYVVVRVFNLLSTRIGFKVYADPWRLKDSGTLQFRAGSWRVTPAGIVARDDNENGASGESDEEL